VKIASKLMIDIPFGDVGQNCGQEAKKAEIEFEGAAQRQTEHYRK
jgi:hypothetical protein